MRLFRFISLWRKCEQTLRDDYVNSTVIFTVVPSKPSQQKETLNATKFCMFCRKRQEQVFLTVHTSFI